MILRSKWTRLGFALVTVFFVASRLEQTTLDTTQPAEAAATPTFRDSTGPREPSRVNDAGARDMTLAECAREQERLSSALAHSDESLSNDLRDDLFFSARALGRLDAKRFERCRTRLTEALVHQTTCGRAASAIAGGLFGADNFQESEILSVLERAPEACRPTFVEAAGFAASFDRRLAESIRGLTKGGGTTARAAWLSLGSIGETSRRIGHKDVAAFVDETIAEALSESMGPDAIYLKAAGNAGCVATTCRDAMKRALLSNDPTNRRIGVAAWRFIEDRSAVASMCSTLERESDSGVRDMAAWALSWRASEPTLRIPCLAESALRDTSHRVRIQSAQSLGILSEELEPARFALVHLADGEAPQEVRDLALRILRTGGAQALVFDERAMGDFLRRAERAKFVPPGSKNF